MCNLYNFKNENFNDQIINTLVISIIFMYPWEAHNIMNIKKICLCIRPFANFYMNI